MGKQMVMNILQCLLMLLLFGNGYSFKQVTNPDIVTS